jgi:hypothetical protein
MCRAKKEMGGPGYPHRKKQEDIGIDGRILLKFLTK